MAGCSGGPTSGLMTSSLAAPHTAAATPAVDPACSALSQQIAASREEGTPARVHAVATGKTKTVSVKRESLAKVAELNRLNAEFQTKCSTLPVQQSAALKPAEAPSAVQVTADAAATAQTASATIAKAKAAANLAKVAGAAPQVGTPIVAVPKQ